MKRLLLAAALTVGFAGAALANNCPNAMKSVDATIPASKQAPEVIAEAKKLRAEGEKLHNEGKHKESMAALVRAQELLVKGK